MNLGTLYAQYVTKAEKERDPLRLFVSDVGKCPRQIAYRLVGTQKDYRSPQSEFNSRIMWDIADHLEATLWAALQDEGMDIAYQFEVPIHDRENWGGRGDIIANYNGRRIIEVKSLYPGAFGHEIEYPAHQYQARVYDHYCRERYELDASPLLWYVDRGGQNTPVEQEVPITWEQCVEAMDTLEGVRLQAEGGNVWYPKMPRRLMLRSYKKKIVDEGAWECGRCNYVWTCMPDTSTHDWAKRENKDAPWELTDKAEPDRMIPFLDSINPAKGTE